MKEVIGPPCKVILEALSSDRTLDRHDIEFLKAFAKELLRVVERIEARGPTLGEISDAT